MSRESKFHNLIEQQENEHKQEVWDRINSDIEIDSTLECETVQASKNMLAINPKKIYIPIAAFLAVIAVVLILIFTLKPNTPNTPLDDLRYCSKMDYSSNDTTQTLKEYSQETNKNLLYFDWYDETESCSDQIVQLNTNNEIICFRESIVDIETGCKIDISVTDNRTVIDFLADFENFCPHLYSFNNIDIKWGGNKFKSMATFEYESNVYYITVADPFEENYIITLIEQLLEG